jgi:hypothetical protein
MSESNAEYARKCRDAAKSVMVGAYLLERADRLRVADLAHRRMSQQGPQPVA